MRAGNLDRVIQIMGATNVKNAFGTTLQTWAPVTTMRAQKLENAIVNSEGVQEVSDNKITFRIRWIASVNLENRVTYNGQQFKIQSIKELGRHVGLDLICERVGQ